MKHWFKAKKYGWGWYPATWQGWLVTLLFVILVSFALPIIQVLGEDSLSEDTQLALFILIVAILMTVFLIICLHKGEKPQWRWGKD